MVSREQTLLRGGTVRALGLTDSYSSAELHETLAFRHVRFGDKETSEVLRDNTEAMVDVN
jgi:hypothetical protein